MKLQPVGPAYLQVARQLRESILSGQLAVGERLPVESQLGAAMGVSRSTVREALRLLASQGLVVTTRGVTGGTTVAHPSPEQIGEYLETSLGLIVGAAAVDRLLEVRRMIEVPAAGLAAHRCGAADVEALRRTVLLDANTADIAELHAATSAFHLGVLAATGNPVLSVLCRPLFQLLRARLSHESAQRSFWRKTQREHDRIHAAIAAGDASAAEAEMSAHLKMLAATYRRIDRIANATSR